MTHSARNISKALFQSLIEGALLLDDLPEADAFLCHFLTMPKEIKELNLEQKLGYLYEDALAVMLESTPRYDFLARGLQLRKIAGHTLGELDFLVRDLISNQLIHLELAVKFYLAVEAESGFLLPGPDARDNYFRKVEKMRSHQLVLVKKYRDLLPEEFQKEEIVAQQLVHGCIFNHVHASKPVEADFLNPFGRRGKWLEADKCKEYFGENHKLKVIPKTLWPVPLDILKGIDLEEFHLDEDMDRCVMVRVDGENLPYFVTPKGYPNPPAERKT